MKSVKPVIPNVLGVQERSIAEHQDEYQTLHVAQIDEGVIIARFELSDAEKAFIAQHGYLYLYMWQGKDEPLRPVLPWAAEPQGFEGHTLPDDTVAVFVYADASLVPEGQALDPHAKVCPTNGHDVYEGESDLDKRRYAQPDDDRA